MKFYNTANHQYTRSFKEAVIEGLAPNKGLFFPVTIPQLDKDFLANLRDYTLPEIAFEVMKEYTEDDISSEDLKRIVEDVFNFDIPLVNVHDDIYSLELFHGPTLAFKDVGARFMSRCLGHFSDRKVKVLVATSGDTGGAVANGFYKVDGVEVIILYPGNKISDIQEQQLTTLGENITAIEIDGTFDDCQKLVKEAFTDQSLNEKMNLSSANSINIARWLPQSIYYYWIAAQLDDKKDISIAVPSGNFGNITAGLLACKSGLKVDQMIAGTNANDIIPKYLLSGDYQPRPSVSTIANAMDVGDPSNYLRLLELYEHDFSKIQSEMIGYSMNDDAIKELISTVYNKHQYIMDPHGAIGYQSLKEKGFENNYKVFLETAHPVKFRDVVEPVINKKLPVPERLAVCLEKKKEAVYLSTSYDEFKNFLLDSLQRA